MRMTKLIRDIEAQQTVKACFLRSVCGNVRVSVALGA